jgi:photosystem II stability/assembly factor-like uncharacterized protein
MMSGFQWARAVLVGTILLSSSGGVLLAQSRAPAAARAAPINATTDPLLRSFGWRSIGPADMGGRVDDIAVVESDPRVYYVGYATGGLWKTVNGGTTFESIFDMYRTVHIGAVAISPSHPDIVWVGTGEANNRQSSSYGDGVYKSTDAGRTFADMGLRGTQSIHRIAVHPTDPDIAFIAAAGALHGPNPERGVYRTTDGGRSWSRVLFVDENTGANNIVIDPSNPNILFASTYQRRRTPWGFSGGGPGSGIWKSEDGGTTWNRLSGNGLPAGPAGRIALDMSRSNPNVIYAQIEVLRNEDRVSPAEQARMAGPVGQRGAVVGDNIGGVWRSSDKGQTWEFRSDHNVRPAYFSKLRVDPKNEDVLYTGGRSFYRSEDGGRTFQVVPGPGHSDHHAIWVNPNDPNHFMVGNDGGFDVTYDRGRTFEAMRPNPVGQFYQVSVDMRRPYSVCGGLQDNGSWCGPSAVGGRFISAHDWFQVGSGDGFYTAVDPSDHNIVYSESQRGGIRRLDLRTGEVAQIQPRAATAQNPTSNVVPMPAAGEQFRWNWNTPFILSPHNPHTIYIGANRLFKSVDRGDTWTSSPDLTKQVDRDRLEIFGVRASAPDCHGDGPVAHGQPCILSKNDGTWFFSAITTLAESSVVPGILWVGTDDGNLQVSQGGLANWTNVTSNLRGAPQNCYVSRVEASHFDAGSAYVSLDCHRNNDMRPYVYMTSDFGRTWTSIASDLPEYGCVNVIKQDPRNPKVLYVGTEFGFFISIDEGRSWKRFMTGLPPVRTDDVVVHPRDGDLVLATHGRSVFIMDDITPLQQLTDEVLSRNVHFFEPRNGLLLRTDPRLTRALPGAKHFRGTNPEAGIAFHYYLRQRPQDSVKLVVSDALTGGQVQVLEGSMEPGINRAQWNLSGASPVRVATDDSDGTSRQAQPQLVNPGAYRVTLLVDGIEHSHGFLVEDSAIAPTRTTTIRD